MLNRLFVAAVLLFAFAECQYGGAPYGGAPYGGAPFGGAPYGGAPYGGFSFGSGYGAGGYGAGGYGAGLGAGAAFGFPYGSPFGGYDFGYKGGNSYNPTSEPSNYLGGTDFSGGTTPRGGFSSSAYSAPQFSAPYASVATPYSGSPIGLPYEPHTYFELYGRFTPQGPPPPPRYSGGAPFGFYEPDTYASGLPPPGYNPRPGPVGLTPINGFVGPLSPNPFYQADPDDIPYNVFQRLYRDFYGRKYDPNNLPSANPPAATTPSPIPVPGSNYYGINYGLTAGNGVAPGYAYNRNSYSYNGYGQPVNPTSSTTTPAPTQPSTTSSAAPPPPAGGGAAPAGK